MSKMKLVVLMEQQKYAWRTTVNAGNMLMNRFCIDEDDAFELPGIYYLKNGFLSHDNLITEPISVSEQNIKGRKFSPKHFFIQKCFERK